MSDLIEFETVTFVQANTNHKIHTTKAIQDQELTKASKGKKIGSYCHPAQPEN